MSDKELQEIVQGCILGQRKEQHLLYQYMAPLLMKVCMRYTASKEHARDFLQEVLIKMFNKINEYRREGPFEAWARRLAVNTIIDILRKEGAISKSLSLDHLGESFHLHVQNEGLKDLDYQDIIQFIHGLPDAKKIVFNLYAVEGYTHKEIAEKLQISEGTSKSQLHKARELLVHMHTKYNAQQKVNEGLTRTY